MPIGSGKYNDICTEVRDGVVLIVLNGERGNGMSAQLSDEASLFLPQVLRALASDIERKGAANA